MGLWLRVLASERYGCFLLGLVIAGLRLWVGVWLELEGDA